jgi:hypothetical protein
LDGEPARQDPSSPGVRCREIIPPKRTRAISAWPRRSNQRPRRLDVATPVMRPGQPPGRSWIQPSTALRMSDVGGGPDSFRRPIVVGATTSIPLWASGLPALLPPHSLGSVLTFHEPKLAVGDFAPKKGVGFASRLGPESHCSTGCKGRLRRWPLRQLQSRNFFFLMALGTSAIGIKRTNPRNAATSALTQADRRFYSRKKQLVDGLRLRRSLSGRYPWRT